MQPTTPPSSRGPNFKASEDLNICHAWIEVSTDAAVSTNQSGEAFNAKLQVIFDARMKEKDSLWVFDPSPGSTSELTFFTVFPRCCEVGGMLRRDIKDQ